MSKNRKGPQGFRTKGRKIRHCLKDHSTSHMKGRVGKMGGRVRAWGREARLSSPFREEPAVLFPGGQLADNLQLQHSQRCREDANISDVGLEQRQELRSHHHLWPQEPERMRPSFHRAGERAV